MAHLLLTHSSSAYFFLLPLLAAVLVVCAEGTYLVCLVMLPVCSPDNPILGGSWQTWQEWLWWVWEFENGWKEWIPAAQMIACFVAQSGQQAGQEVDRREVVTKTLQMLGHLHQRLVGSQPSFHELMAAQMAYNRQSKSDWYYATLPAYSFLAALFHPQQQSY